MRPERVSRYFALAARLGLVGIAINHFNRADDEDLAGGAKLEKGVALPKGNFRLIDLDDPLQWFAIWIDHRSSQLLRQPGPRTRAGSATCPSFRDHDGAYPSIR